MIRRHHEPDNCDDALAVYRWRAHLDAITQPGEEEG